MKRHQSHLVVILALIASSAQLDIDIDTGIEIESLAQLDKMVATAYSN